MILAKIRHLFMFCRAFELCFCSFQITIQIVFECSKLCSARFLYVQIVFECSNYVRLVSNMFCPTFKLCSSVLNYVRLVSNMSKLCSSVLKYVRLISNMFCLTSKLCSSVLNYVRLVSNMFCLTPKSCLSVLSYGRHVLRCCQNHDHRIGLSDRIVGSDHRIGSSDRIIS